MRTHKLIIGLAALCFGLIAINISAIKAPAPMSSISYVGNHLPFDVMANAEYSPQHQALSSKKKVFAHYFLPYPLSFNNSPPEQSYYQQQYLNPAGEKGKFRTKGGLLRQRPLPRAPMPDFVDYKMEDLRQEVRLAKAVGIDGFAVNIMTMEGQLWDQTERLVKVAQEENFSILVMPDMNAVFKRHPDQFETLITVANQWPSAYRLDNGSLVISPYMAENQAPIWWKNTKQALAKQGINIALVPVFHNMKKQLARFESELGDQFVGLFYGVSDWGPRTPSGAKRIVEDIQLAQQKDLVMMAPVSPQDVRPKSSKFTDAHNSETYRALWISAIENEVPWVHIVSWNDYSESTEVSPSTLTQYAFYDLTAYYSHWFKQGQPPIVRDTLYGFYRSQSWKDKPVDPMLEFMHPTPGSEPKDEIELLAFAKQPATLEIEIANSVHQIDVESGISSFKVPLHYGQPQFRMVRNNTIDSYIYDTPAIEKPVTVSNLMYQGVGSGRIAPFSEALLSWPWRDRDFDEGMALVQLKQKSSFLPNRDDGLYEFKDGSAKANSGMGFSFNEFQSQHRSLEITYDIKMKGSQQNQGEFVMDLMEANSQKALLSIKVLPKSFENYCLRFNQKQSESLGCAFVLKSDAWYRFNIRITRDHPEFVDTVLAITDQKGVQENLTKKITEVPSQPVNGIVFKTTGKPEVQGELAMDNLKVSIN